MKVQLRVDSVSNMKKQSPLFVYVGKSDCSFQKCGMNSRRHKKNGRHKRRHIHILDLL